MSFVNKNRGETAFQILATLFFTCVCLICLIPVINIAAISFSAKNAILSGQVFLLPVGFTISAYKQTLSNGGFLFSFQYSILLTILHASLAMTLTVLCAFPLSKKDLPGKNAFMAVILVTMYFTPGVIPGYLNIKSLGLLDTIWALALPGAVNAYNVIIMRSFFTGIDENMYDAAYIDGARHGRALASIAIPLAAPCIATLSLFYAVGRWNGVNDVIFYITDPRLYTAQMKLKQMMESADVGREEGALAVLTAESVKAAAIMISMSPMLALYPFIHKYFTRGIMLGAIKG